MPGSFGARMRERREQQGISLSSIAEQTKIKRSLLDALERDDVSQWPAGFFGRAFVRAYAQSVGLNPDDAVREFLQAHPEPVEVVAAAGAAVPGSDGGLRAFVGSALGGSLGRLRRTPAPAEPLSVVVADVDFTAVARLCTELARVRTTRELQARLQEAARILEATGLILWVWDARAAELKPALAHGYPDDILAQFPTVTREADNATAAAFRLGETCAIDGTEQKRGALAVPLLTPAGCAGVLAIEFLQRREQTASIRAAATIVAAVLAQLIASA